MVLRMGGANRCIPCFGHGRQELAPQKPGLALALAIVGKSRNCRTPHVFERLRGQRPKGFPVSLADAVLEGVQPRHGAVFNLLASEPQSSYL